VLIQLVHAAKDCEISDPAAQCLATWYRNTRWSPQVLHDRHL